MNGVNDVLDLRVRRTYKFLWDALITLMMERDFEAITVTDTCQQAMVHRTTFYKHFEDKQGLLFHGIQEELNALFEEMDLRLGKAVVVMDEPDTGHLVILFEHILKRKRFYRLMLGGNATGEFYTLFRKFLVEHLKRRAVGHFHREEGHVSLRNELRLQSHMGALLSAVTWWLENDCPYTPVQMAQYLWADAFSRH
jgi:AcrR family transcriptional regulator